MIQLRVACALATAIFLVPKPPNEMLGSFERATLEIWLSNGSGSATATTPGALVEIRMNSARICSSEQRETTAPFLCCVMPRLIIRISTLLERTLENCHREPTSERKPV